MTMNNLSENTLNKLLEEGIQSITSDRSLNIDNIFKTLEQRNLNLSYFEMDKEEEARKLPPEYTKRILQINENSLFIDNTPLKLEEIESNNVISNKDKINEQKNKESNALRKILDEIKAEEILTYKTAYSRVENNDKSLVNSNSIIISNNSNNNKQTTDEIDFTEVKNQMNNLKKKLNKVEKRLDDSRNSFNTDNSIISEYSKIIPTNRIKESIKDYNSEISTSKQSVINKDNLYDKYKQSNSESTKKYKNKGKNLNLTPSVKSMNSLKSNRSSVTNSIKNL